MSQENDHDRIVRIDERQQEVIRKLDNYANHGSTQTRELGIRISANEAEIKSLQLSVSKIWYFMLSSVTGAVIGFIALLDRMFHGK